MEKAESITREEAGKICVTMATNLRHGVLNEIQVLRGRLFDTIPSSEEEFFPIWTMAGGYLKHIVDHLNDTLEDIEAGRYLPQQKEA
jgi:hypothetical protein